MALPVLRVMHCYYVFEKYLHRYIALFVADLNLKLCASRTFRYGAFKTYSGSE